MYCGGNTVDTTSFSSHESLSSPSKNQFVLEQNCVVNEKLCIDFLSSSDNSIWQKMAKIKAQKWTGKSQGPFYY